MPTLRGMASLVTPKLIQSIQKRASTISDATYTLCCADIPTLLGAIEDLRNQLMSATVRHEIAEFKANRLEANIMAIREAVDSYKECAKAFEIASVPSCTECFDNRDIEQYDEAERRLTEAEERLDRVLSGQINIEEVSNEDDAG